MFAPKDIVVPTDFSECSELAMQVAADMAEYYDARLHIIHVVVNDIEQMPFLLLGSEKTADLNIKIKDNAVKQMHCVVSKIIGNKHVNYETHLAAGVPSQEILALTDRLNADLIVISPRGKTVIEGFLFGSTTNRVVHKAKCNVLVTKTCRHDIA